MPQKKHVRELPPRLTPQQHWDQVLKGEHRGARTRRKLAANRDRNWLIAIFVHAATKAQAGAPLSDLEQLIVKQLREASHKTDLVAALAYVGSNTPPEVKHEIFPSDFAQLSKNDSVTFKRLGQLAPDIIKRTIGAPNTKHIDVKAMHLKNLTWNQVKPDTHTLGIHANSLLRVVSQSEASPSASMVTEQSATSSSAPIANRYKIKAGWFKCLEETSEWSASDEVYWLYAVHATTKNWSGELAGITRVYNDVDWQESFEFGPAEGCLFGFDCQPHEFPQGELGAVITLMEHDYGDISDIRTGFFSLLGVADAILAATGAAAWIAAFLTALGGLIGWILSFFDDDHIADQTYTFDRASINEVLDKHGGSYDAPSELSDGDAAYELHVNVSRVV